MSFLSDLFNGPQNAANSQIQGIEQGLIGATTDINQGTNALNTNYTAALQPYLTNYAQGQQGVTQLGNVLGLNGAAGNQSALAALQTTPGYQFQQQQGNNAINAAAAANGTLNSGNQNIALANYNQGLAGTTYNNYVSQLQPYMNYSSNAAGGINSTYTGLGNAINANDNSLAQLFMGATTGIGNAQANADLANQQTDLGLLKGIAGLGTSALGGGLGSLASSFSLGNIGNALSGASSIFPSYMTGSDERIKEEIEPVGELYDGSQIYRYFYKGDDRPQIGLLAQEVEQRYPDAVGEYGGIKAVHYGKATQYAADLAKLFDEDRPEHKRSADVVEFGGRSNGCTSYAADLTRLFGEAA